MTETPTPEGEDLVERAVKAFIQHGLTEPEAAVEDVSPKSQPWAETASPTGHNKRPLEELLAEIQAKVVASPNAVAHLPRATPPGEVVLDRFNQRPAGAPTSGGGARRKRRRGGRGNRRGGGGGGDGQRRPEGRS